MNNSNLKKLSDYKDEIHRCSKCGLCQAACPLYEITGNECSVSRGQFIMLDGVIKKKLTMSKNINKYLDLCLKCNKCSDFCPSNIDVVDIILSAKHEYFKKSLEGKIYSFLESKLVFNTLLKIIRIIISVFCPKIKSETYETKAVYFGGCISAVRPDITNYVTKILNKMKIEVVKSDMDCCGMPFLTTGNIERFCEAIEENVSKIPDNVEMIITDCASCEWVWNRYCNYIGNEFLKEKLEKIKIKNIYDLIQDNDINFEAKNTCKIAYHKPCHEESCKKIEKIIRNIKNCEYCEMDNYDKCCGFASYEHPCSLKITEPLRKIKKQAVNSSKADIIITSCVGCLISLKLITRKKTRRVISFLKDYCKII